MRYVFLILCFGIQISVAAQVPATSAKAPVFANCESEAIDALKTCFNSELQRFLVQNFKPIFNDDDDDDDDSLEKSQIDVLFEVEKTGAIRVLYVGALNTALKVETERVFKMLPIVAPATFNGESVFVQYSISFNYPLEPMTSDEVVDRLENITTDSIAKPKTDLLVADFDDINAQLQDYNHSAYSSHLNLPFTHQTYSRFDKALNSIGTNAHTASKPFLYADVSTYYDLVLDVQELLKEGSGWLHRKLWNEHMVQVQSEHYWFTIDPIVDLQIGQASDTNFKYTYNNTRGVYIQGGLAKQLNFSASVYESQGRFADYFNRHAENLKAFGPDPAIIPGRGIAKRFNKDAYDYPSAEGYLSYTPSEFFNIQFGHGKHFIGDGYRSLFQSDVASAAPYIKINTNFWKIKYTNTWMWLRDVRPEVEADKAFLTKYMANHYLSWNVSKRLNVGFFESVVWANSNNRGFDVNYLNPLIFYRAIEFQTGQGAGNAIVGISGKYKLKNAINIYSQFVLDEFSLSDIKAQNKSWKNKFGYQVGVKYFDAFKLNHLNLQMEYNHVRPYTYSHNTIVLNYAHDNQPMAHLWGANFKETILRLNYSLDRWFIDAKYSIGLRGFDFNSAEDGFSYGGDIYRNYNHRPFDTGIQIGQGIKTQTQNASMHLGYTVNPVSRLRVFAELSYRNFDPNATTVKTFKNSTVWFNLGLRTDLSNWYSDF